MTESQPPAGEARRSNAHEPKRGTPWTPILIGVAVLYALIVAILNSDRVEVDFLFFSADVRLLVLIVLCLGLGFASGFFFDRWRERRKRRDRT